MKMATTKSHLLVGLAALSSIMTAQLAAAEVPEQTEPKSVVVRYSDLDLSSPRDARQLYGRIKRAAHEACEAPPMNELTRLTQYERCLHHAITDAVAQVSSSQLNHILQADMPQSPRG